MTYSLLFGLKLNNHSESGVITYVVKGVKVHDNEVYEKYRKFEAFTE